MAEEEKPPPRISLFQVVVAIVVASAVFIGYVIATLPPAPPEPSDVAQPGDAVAVDYIGYFENGRVFDTNIEEVAEDDANYPKALSFQTKESYRPLEFFIEGSTSTVIEGFEKGVEGMRRGETKVIQVPPEEGYGPPDATMIEIRPLITEITQFETLTVEAFNRQFAGTPVQGIVFEHPIWGWDVSVTVLTEDFVTVMHLPEQGMVVRPHGAWEASIVEVDSSGNGGLGLIAIQHLLDTGDVDNVKAEDEGGTFRVVDVDVGAGTYTVDYNEEVVGKTLVFWVKLLLITRF